MFILMYSCYILSYAVLYNRFETNQRGRHGHDRIGSWIYNYLLLQGLSYHGGLTIISVRDIDLVVTVK
jgi:hypothetical protein